MMKDFLEKSDRRLRSLFSLRRAFLRLRSLYSGIPYEKLKLYHLIGVRLDQILIVERGTGRLIGEWSDSSKIWKGNSAARRQSVKASMLAAIGEFEKNPEVIFRGKVRALDHDGLRTHLHATPSYILGARYAGPAIRKLDRHIDAALRKSLGTAPALLSFMGGTAAELQGFATQAASAIEKRLLEANLPPHGKVSRPVFAYAAAAALGLVFISATGDAIVQRYAASRTIPAYDLKHSAKGEMAIPATPESMAVAIRAADGDREVPGGRRVPAEGAEAAPGSGASAGTLPGAAPAELASWQINRALLQLSQADGSEVTAAPAAIVDDAVKSALAQLPNFDQGSGVKLDSLNRFDPSSQAAPSDLASAAGFASSSLRATGISVSDRGVQVGLFSLSSDGNSTFSPGGLGLTSEAPAGLTSGESAGAANGVSTAASAATSAAAQTLNSATATVRGLAR
jgi:hypothetical protein